MDERLKKQLELLSVIDRMKSVYRRNVIADGSRRGETDAEHSWHLCLYAITLAEYAPRGTDIDRTVRLCLTHDLVEVYAGDTFCYDEAGYRDKEQRERAAADRLFALLPPEQEREFHAYWEEFEQNETDEAKFANALDRMQPFLLNAATEFHTWHQSAVTAEKILEREAPVKEYFPDVFSYAEACVNDALKSGLIKER